MMMMIRAMVDINHLETLFFQRQSNRNLTITNNDNLDDSFDIVIVNIEIDCRNWTQNVLSMTIQTTERDQILTD